jgi:hypothetical protein
MNVKSIRVRLMFLLLIITSCVLLVIFVGGFGDRNLGSFLISRVRKFKLEHGYARINKLSAENNLITFSDICENLNIPFMIDCGTALGAIRDNDFIDTDTDTDISIMLEHYENFFQNALPLLKTSGFQVIKNRQLNNSKFMSFYRNHEFMDVDFVKSGFLCQAVPGPCDDILPLLQQTQQVRLRSRFYATPTIPYIEYLYGSDWATPKTGFKCFQVDRS